MMLKNAIRPYSIRAQIKDMEEGTFFADPDAMRTARDFALEKAGEAHRDGASAREELWLSEARRFEDQIRSLREGHGTKKEMCDV